jgi:hypothetical protein
MTVQELYAKLKACNNGYELLAVIDGYIIRETLNVA